MEWKPIESAPKDGTMILLAPLTVGPRRGNKGVGTGYWYTPHPEAKNQRGFWITNFSHGPRGPTHWMPLPPPPRSEGDE